MGEIIYLSNAQSSTSLSNILHDMSSPLGALEIASQKLDNLNDQDKKMILLATQRLSDLLKKYRNQRINPVKKFSPLKAINEIIYEKEYENKLGICLTKLQDLNSVEINGEEGEFKRLLSNLINNSIEALKEIDIKKISIVLSLKQNHFQIDICDNGTGLTQNEINLILEHAKSSKHLGAGIGVAHAKSTIESWGGDFSMKSAKNRGTTITITLPTFAKLSLV